MTKPLRPDWLAWPETQALIGAFGESEFRFVGGAVRDALLGRIVKDIDVATPLTPDAVTQKLNAARIKVVPTGIDHGTVTAVVMGKPFEITTLRKDVTTDGRRALVAFTDNWKDDAQRRDFTMNALYVSAQGELFDYFGGAQDATAGRVRFIGDPGERIREDALRILRFFRFFAHYGVGEVDIPGLSACGSNARDIEKLSGERICAEMAKLLVAERAAETVILMQQYRIWNYVVPHKVGVHRLRALPELLRKAGCAPHFVLALAALLLTIKEPDALAMVVEAIASRWKLSKGDARRLRNLCDNAIPAVSSQAQWKRQIRAQGKEFFIDRMLLQATAESDPEEELSAIALAQSWVVPVFPITGDDLIARGIKPGREMGEQLKRLEEEWERSGYGLSKDKLLSFPAGDTPHQES